MFRSEPILLLVCLLSTSHALPMGCSEDDHCPTGFYCELSSLFCQKCLSCQLLNRLPPSKEIDCVVDVNDCGACYMGLVWRGDACVHPPARPELPPYVWAVVALGLFVCFTAAVALALLRNFPTLKILACCTATRTTTVHRQKPPETDSPPPYDAVAGNAQPPTEVTAMKESTPFLPTAKESASVQQARAYNPPDYPTEATESAEDSSQLNTAHEQPAESEESSVIEVVADYGSEGAMATPTKPQDSNNNEDASNGPQSQSGGASSGRFQYHNDLIMISVIKNINSPHTCGSPEHDC